MSRCRKRFKDIFDGEKEPGQPLAAVQQEELVRVAEGAIPVAQLAQVEQEPQQQRAIIPEPIAIPPQPFSSSHEDPRRARIPEDEDDAKTVRPRWDMSALIRELCERDVPEIDGENAGEDNSSVFDIYTGLKLDEAQVKAGRETEVKRMLEFEVRDEVSEELARGKRIWNSTWLDPQKKMGLVSSRQVVKQVRGACKRDDVFAARGHGRYHGLWCVLVRPPKNMKKDKTIWKLLKDMHGTQVASSRWQRLASVPCVAYNEKEDSLVSSHGDDFFAWCDDSSLETG